MASAMPGALEKMAYNGFRRITRMVSRARSRIAGTFAKLPVISPWRVLASVPFKISAGKPISSREPHSGTNGHS